LVYHLREDDAVASKHGGGFINTVWFYMLSVRLLV